MWKIKLIFGAGPHILKKPPCTFFQGFISYLKTDLLYASEIEAHAEALYWLSQLWPKIGENQRATEAKSRLAKLYPTSLWLKK